MISSKFDGHTVHVKYLRQNSWSAMETILDVKRGEAYTAVENGRVPRGGLIVAMNELIEDVLPRCVDDTLEK